MKKLNTFNDCKTTGERIKFLRQMAHMTQEQLAEALNVTNKSLSKYEHDFGISIDIIIALSKIFNVSCDVLLKGSDDSSKYRLDYLCTLLTPLNDEELKFCTAVIPCLISNLPKIR